MNAVGTVQLGLFLVFFAAILGLAIWALVDCLTRPARAFPAADKRTRTFWAGILTAAVVVAFLALPLGFVNSNFFQFLALLGAVAAVVYLVDVRPAVKPYSGRGPRGGPSRGGW